MATKDGGIIGLLTNSSLRKWNQGLAAVFFVQAVAIIVASAARLYPVTISFLGVDTLQTQAAGQKVMATGSHHLFDLNLVFVVSAFLLVAAIAHGLAATKLRSIYELGLKTGINKIRWIEYAFGAGLVIIAVGLLVGAQDFATLLVLPSLMVAASLLGLIVEKWGASHTGWLAFSLGSITGGLAWLVIAVYLIGSALYGSPPTFTWIIAVVTLLLFVASGVNLYLQQRKFGMWSNYLYSEKMFMVLSLITKTALAWLLFAAVLHP